MNKDAGYWEMGVALVPNVTGASGLMDARDVPSLAAALGFKLPLPSVLDVGCGTGRIARHCEKYYGLDISRDAVAYCQTRGINAAVIDGPESLAAYANDYEWVFCMSVFTHISEADRAVYLKAFKALAPNLLVDIIPGDGRGGVALWTSDVKRFERLLEMTGYTVEGVTERTAPTGDHLHRYYYARVA